MAEGISVEDRSPEDAQPNGIAKAIKDVRRVGSEKKPLEPRQVEALERIAVALEKLLRLSQLFAASYDVQYGHGVLKEAADELLKMEQPQHGEEE